MGRKPKRVILIQEGCCKRRDECGCFKGFRRCKIIRKIIKFIKRFICYLKARSRETLVFGDSSNSNTKVKNILTMPKFICPGEEFTLDLITIIQVCCSSPESVGIISVETLSGQLTGPAQMIDFTTGVVLKCLSGCPEGTVTGAITPDGKEINLSFSAFEAEANSNIPGQSKVKKCCKTRLELLADETNGNQIIRFEGSIGGQALLPEGCDGPFNNTFTLDFIIDAKFVDSEHPCCIEKQKKCKCEKNLCCKHIKSRCKKKDHTGPYC